MKDDTYAGLLLVVPEKADIEREAVLRAWRSGGGKVSRLGRFWEPPSYKAEAVRLYGNSTFCEILAQKLALRLISPAQITSGTWILLEANATWGAGLNGCCPNAVARCLVEATKVELG